MNCMKESWYWVVWALNWRSHHIPEALCIYCIPLNKETGSVNLGGSGSVCEASGCKHLGGKGCGELPCKHCHHSGLDQRRLCHLSELTRIWGKEWRVPTNLRLWSFDMADSCQQHTPTQDFTDWWLPLLPTLDHASTTIPRLGTPLWVEEGEWKGEWGSFHQNSPLLLLFIDRTSWS